MLNKSRALTIKIFNKDSDSNIPLINAVINQTVPRFIIITFEQKFQKWTF